MVLRQGSGIPLDEETGEAIDSDEEEPERPRRTLFRELIQTVLLAALIYFVLTSIIPPYQVDGASMSPNLQNGERLFVNRSVYFHFDLNEILNWLPNEHRQRRHEIYLFHQPRRGEIIVFHPPVDSDKPYIKRVIGLPGDTITFHGGHVYVNGTRLNEPYIDGPITFCSGPMHCEVGPIPAGYVFVLGDNRMNSADSRYFGLVKMDSIIGKAWIANWPIKDIGFAPNYSFPGQ